MIDRLPLSRITAALERIRHPGQKLRRAVLTIGSVAFLLIVAWGVDGYRSAGFDADLRLLVIAAVVGTPLALALNAVELRIMARAADVELTPRESIIATLFASAANSLPLPGSLLVRGWSLADKGATLATVARVQAVAGVTFIAVALGITGPIIVTTNLVFGLSLTAVGGITVLGLLVRGPREARNLMIIEAAMIASELGRFALVLAALGVGVTPSRVAGLVVANVLAVAIGIFPAGLGVREGLAAVIATTTTLGSSLAVTISVTDRVATSLVLACLVTVVWLIGLRPKRAASTNHPPPGRSLKVSPDPS